MSTAYFILFSFTPMNIYKCSSVTVIITPLGGRILMYNGNSYFANDKYPFIS